MASLRRSSGSQHHLSTVVNSTINSNKHKIGNVNMMKEKELVKGDIERKKKEDLKMSKAELGDYVSNKKNSSNHVNKKQTQHRTNSILNTKRPQTPDPISSHLPPSLQIELPKYSQPETILKQIQKNVNFLKQMYYASLTQTQSQSHSHHQMEHGSSFIHQQNHNHSNQSDIQQYQMQNNVGKRNYKKVRPSINLVQHHINYNHQNDNHEQKYETKKNNNKDVNEVKSKSKSAQKKQKMNQQRRKSSSNTQINTKTTLANKSSIHNTKQKLSTNKYQPYNIQKNNSKHTSPNSFNNSHVQVQVQRKQSATPNNSSVPSSNINSLFQIFKYYKRSIDSSLSKRQQNYNSHSNANNVNNQTDNTTIRNNQSHRSSMSNIYTNNPINFNKDDINKNMKKNHIENQPSSSSHNNNINNKDTPNNSTTKNTTNNKNNTISQLYGSSIQPSIQVSFDQQQQVNAKNTDKFQNKNDNADKNRSSKMSKRSRKSSKSNSAKKSIEQQKVKGNSNKCKGKNSSNKSQKKSQQIKKSNFHNDDINLKDHKDYHKELMHIKTKHENKKQTIKQSKQSNNNTKKHKKPSTSSVQQQNPSLFKKKSERIPELNSNLHPKTTTFQPCQEHQYQHDHIDFPQIQCSLFDRNMPILQQDSREDVSSELLAITGRKQCTIREQFRENSQNYINQSQKQIKSVKQRGSNNQTRMNFVQRNRLQLQFQQIQFSMKNSRDNITGQNSKQQQQNTRFPTPSFVLSDISQKNDKNIKICNPQSAPKNNNCLRIDQINHEIKEQLQKQKQKYLSQSQRKKCDDSLAGCQIPKRYSDQSLDNFQLVSIEL